VLLSQNQALGNGAYGFWVQPKLAYGFYGTVLKFSLRDNLARGTGRGSGTGFYVAPGSIFCDGCFDYADAHEVTTAHNFAENAFTGFWMYDSGPITDNVSSGNTMEGFTLIAFSQPFLRNSAAGNGGPGVIYYFEYEQVQANPALGISGPFQQNSFYGNDRNRPPLVLQWPIPPIDSGSSAHCGVLNLGATYSNPFLTDHLPPVPQPPFPPTTVKAAQNYWGSAAGPQPKGSGDAAGAMCDQNNGVTVYKPFNASRGGIVPLP
jgi:hypothetical protein